MNNAVVGGQHEIIIKLFECIIWLCLVIFCGQCQIMVQFCYDGMPGLFFSVPHSSFHISAFEF